MSAAEEAEETKSSVVYWALNGYGVSAFEIVVGCMMVILAAWIITLNALVFDTLVRVKGRKGEERKPGDWLVSSLSLADMVSGVFLVYNTVYNLTNFQIRVECLVRNSLLNAALFSSVFHLCLLTADRYIMIIAPYRYNTICNRAYVVTCTCVTWAISMVLSLLPTFGWSDRGGGIQSDGTELPVCSFFGLMHPDYLRVLVCLFFTPCLLMMIVYAHIFKIASRHARVIAAHERGRSQEKHSWRFTKTVLIIMGLYFLVWLPAGLLIILEIEGHLNKYTVEKKGTLLMYCSLPAFAGSVINPIIYAFKITAVRARFRAIFCRRNYVIHNEMSVSHVATASVANTCASVSNHHAAKDAEYEVPVDRFVTRVTIAATVSDSVTVNGVS